MSLFRTFLYSLIIKRSYGEAQGMDDGRDGLGRLHLRLFLFSTIFREEEEEGQLN